MFKYVFGIVHTVIINDRLVYVYAGRPTRWFTK